MKAAAPEKKPYVRVTAPSADRATECAGQLWAGVSEVPASSLTDAQLLALKADKRLQVEEIQRFDIEPDLVK